MNTLPPLPYSFHEPIPVGEVTEREAMPMELAEAMCPGFTEECKRLRWAKGVEGMDSMGAYCDAGSKSNA